MTDDEREKLIAKVRENPAVQQGCACVSCKAAVKLASECARLAGEVGRLREKMQDALNVEVVEFKIAAPDGSDFTEHGERWFVRSSQAKEMRHVLRAALSDTPDAKEATDGR